MRVLYIAMADDYGDPRRGPSFEETNFRSALDGMGHEVVPFDFMAEERRHGTEEMRRRLVATAAEVAPDVSFSVLFTDQIDVPTIEAVRRAARTPVVNWFADDHWRFEGWSRHLAPAFDLAVTTDPSAVARYRAAGIEQVFLSQWACNRYAYFPRPDAPPRGVTFVGQAHGNRPQIVGRLRNAGIEVECHGLGWSSGRVSHDEMLDIFSGSSVNLNLSNSSADEPTTLLENVARRLRLRRPPPPRPPQIKGRNFEVPGCGGFLLTERLPYLERYFELGREVAVYDDEDDLVEQLRHWLDRPDERAAVAAAGYARVVAEHTYDHRFAEIFAAAGAGEGP